MKAFITGATGFIGSHLLRKLIESGDYEKIYVLTRKGSVTENIKDIITSQNVEIVRGDLLDPSTYISVLEKCEHIYHTAGFIGTHKAYREAVFKLNYETSHNLLETLWKRRPEKIVYLASIFALGKGKDKEVADENVVYNLEKLARLIPYFSAKRKADAEAFKYAEKGLNIVFGYPCYCLGPGDIYLSSSRILLAGMKGFHFYSDGGINIVDVRDVAEGLYLCMKNGKSGEKYLLGGYNISFKEFFIELNKITGKCYPYIKIPHGLLIFAGIMGEKLLGKKSIVDEGSARIMCEYWFYSSEKAKRELGYKIRPLHETLRDAVQWFREHPTYYGKRIL